MDQILSTFKDTPDATQDRWLRFREAVEPNLTAETWDALQAAWDATMGVPTKCEPEPAKAAPSEVLPRVVKWSDLQSGDLALDVDYLGPSFLAHALNDECVWRRRDGVVGRVCGDWGFAQAPRAVLFAHNVPDNKDAVQLACTDLKITPELEAEARRPAP